MLVSLQKPALLLADFEISLSTFSSARVSLFRRICGELHQYTQIFLLSELRSVSCSASVPGLDLLSNARRGDGERCMKDITAPDVVSSIRQMLNQPRNPLSVESIEIR